MREIIVAEFITLDGVIQAPGGADEDTEGGFSHGGWTWPYWHDDIGAHYVYPLVLDSGKRLYPQEKRLDLTLVETSPLPTGVVFMRYRRSAS